MTLLRALLTAITLAFDAEESLYRFPASDVVAVIIELGERHVAELRHSASVDLWPERNAVYWQTRIEESETALGVWYILRRCRSVWHEFRFNPNADAHREFAAIQRAVLRRTIGDGNYDAGIMPSVFR